MFADPKNWKETLTTSNWTGFNFTLRWERANILFRIYKNAFKTPIYFRYLEWDIIQEGRPTVEQVTIHIFRVAKIHIPHPPEKNMKKFLRKE
jgi:hypothetical protein